MELGRGVPLVSMISGQNLLEMILGGGKVYCRTSSRYVHLCYPYFDNPLTLSQTETYISGAEPFNSSLHGMSGPISVTHVKTSHLDRQYPLRSEISALFESGGYTLNPDGNSGSLKGYCELTENWKKGVRQPASVAYEVAKCTNVTILTSTLVYKVLFDASNTRAIGIQTSEGAFYASKETILCAGAYCSPHLLLLSGIGPASTLATHGIPLVLDLPDVGKNLHDHPAVPLYWKLKEQGNAMDVNPDAKLSAPQFRMGLPVDWIPAVPITAKSEGADEVTVRHLSHPERCHTEIFFAYVPAGPGAKKFKPDGKTITSWVMAMTPTSRGSVTLASSDPTVHPVIDPNYCATEADRTALRNGMRKVLALTSNLIGQSLFETELTDHVGDTDTAIDARLKEYGNGLFHPAGTCAMGKVVDGGCQVVGIDGLRVVDASVIPLPLGAHYQAAVYALAEKVADSI
jgi:choline dehydrogenase-like flavoprotein